jgi:hypothetical protein
MFFYFTTSGISEVALESYLRQFDTFHRPILAICPDLSAESMGFLPSLKIGEFLALTQLW